MTTDGGGWTAFFSGQNGSPNKFADFEGTVNIWYNSEKYLRRIPFDITIDNWFMASIETLGKRAKFQINTSTLAFFKTGSQSGWQANANTTTLTGTITYPPNSIWTGSVDYNSFVLAATAGTVPGFMSSYIYNNWNQCDGVTDTTSLIRLFYR